MTSLVVLQDKPSMSLCWVCPKPGAWCTRFTLSGGPDTDQPVFWINNWREDALAYAQRNKFPFVPIGIAQTWTDDVDGEYMTPYWSCPKVSSDGRCTIYAERPTLCREFEPGSCALCVFDGFAIRKRIPRATIASDGF